MVVLKKIMQKVCSCLESIKKKTVQIELNFNMQNRIVLRTFVNHLIRLNNSKYLIIELYSKRLESSKKYFQNLDKDCFRCRKEDEIYENLYVNLE